MTRVLLLFFLLTVFSTPNYAGKAEPESDLEKVLAGIQARQNKIKSFSADFNQIFTHKFGKIGKKTSEGKVKFKKPGLMRWDYKDNKQSFIVDGKALWWDKREEVWVNKCFKHDSLTASVSFLWGDGDILKLFDAEEIKVKVGDASDINIQLTPKEKSSFYKRLTLVVDKKNNQVKQSIVIDGEGNRNHFIFSNVEFDKNVNAKDFAFVPAKGVKVFDLPGSENCKSQE